jgi:limonene-1,2-epoxide hydrolase
MIKKNNIENYVKLFESLNLKNLHKFDKLLDENIYFEDPFNKVYGIENFKKIFSNTLTKLDNVEFKVLNIISKNNIYIIKWEMIYFAFNKTNSIFGLSEVTISENNKIVSHIDYWDSYNNFYTKIPFLGLIFKFVLSLVRKRI